MSTVVNDALGPLLSALLQHDVNGKAMRLIMAAALDGGPVSKTDWAVRAGLSQAHFARTLAETERLKIIETRVETDGLKLFVSDPAFWRVTPLVTDAKLASAWARPQDQSRLPLATEGPDLRDALALTKMVSAHQNGESSASANTRSISVLEKKIGTDRVEKGVELSRLGGTDRAYLLLKLSRMHRLQQEILKPQNVDQRRMARLFWQAEQQDVDWIKSVLADLADRTDVLNKAAWLNRALTKWASISSQTNGNGSDGAQYHERGRTPLASTSAIGIGLGPSQDKPYG